jgi:hypothetical protein
MFFFIKKVNNSGYNSNQLNKLILFESYEKKKNKRQREQENISIKKPISED